MHVAISKATVEDSYWLTPEEQAVTFQIALVGCDGLVIGSDRLARHTRMIDGKPQLSQITYPKKYFSSPSNSLACFAAGGTLAQDVARQITQDCDPTLKLKGTAESEWEIAVRRIATATMLPYRYPIDEILVARADVTNAFWLVSRKLADATIIFASVQKMGQHFCTGDSTVAQFLPRHLWTQNRSVLELRKLALLTLSYAAQEEPASVGPPFDIMILDRTGHITWSEHSAIHEKFQSELERAFTEEMNI